MDSPPAAATFFPVRPTCKPEVQEDNELNGDYDFYRPVIRVESA